MVFEFSRNERLYETDIICIDSQKLEDIGDELNEINRNQYLEEIKKTKQRVFKFAVLNMPLLKQNERKCEVLNSLIILGEKGLVATQFIPLNSLITNYPPHWLISNESHTNRIRRTRVIDISNMSFEINYKRFFSCVKYVIECQGNWIAGDPTLIDDHNFLAHMANDSFNTGLESNAHFQLNFINGKMWMSLISSKDINPGEEIFVSYGSEYWESDHRITKENIIMYTEYYIKNKSIFRHSSNIADLLN